MQPHTITADAAAALLEPHRFDFFAAVQEPIGSVLVFPQTLTVAGNLHVSKLIPVDAEGICCILVQGDLRVSGTVSNYLHPNGRRDLGMNLIVLGRLQAQSLMSTNATVFVSDDLVLQEAAYVYYDNGRSELRVDGSFKAKGLIVNDEHRTRIEDFAAEHDLDLYNCDFDEVAAVVRSDLLSDETEKIDHKALVRALEAGEPVFL